MAQIYHAYGVDMDLKHGAIALVTVQVRNGFTSVLNIRQMSTWDKTGFGKDTPTKQLVEFAKWQAKNIVPNLADQLAIEWDRNRVYYKGARKSAVVQAATMIGAFLSKLPVPYFDYTPATKRKLLKDKAMNWDEFALKTNHYLWDVKDYPEIDRDGDITDAAAIALYHILTHNLGEDL